MKYTYKCMSFPGQNYPKLLATHSALLDKVCFISLVHHSCNCAVRNGYHHAISCGPQDLDGAFSGPLFHMLRPLLLFT